MMTLVDLQVIDEIASHVVGGPRIEPDVPARNRRGLLWHQRQLNLSSGFELVSGHELVFQLQHQHAQEQDAAEIRKPDVDVESLGVDTEPRATHDEKEERRCQHHAARRGELQQKPPEQPPAADEEAAYRPHGGQPLAILLWKVERLQAGHRVAYDPPGAALLKVYEDFADVLAERLEQARRRTRAG